MIRDVKRPWKLISVARNEEFLFGETSDENGFRLVNFEAIIMSPC